MTRNSYEGILVVDKKTGPTSHDVVAALRSILGVRRIGHCGTLDPLATGVLVICVGGYTRLNQWLSQGEKEYEAGLVLGATSDTCDAQGKIVETPAARVPSLDEVGNGVRSFVGTIEQVPPAYSAVKVNGVRSYKLARADRPVELEPRTVTVASIEVESYDYPSLALRVTCGRGTYIRSLAADLGQLLGCGAYIDRLRRTSVGTLGLDRAVSVEQIRDAASSGSLERHFAAPREALRELPEIVLDQSHLQRFAHGGRVEMEIPGWDQDSRVCAIYDPSQHLCGIGEWNGLEHSVRPLKVFRPADELSRA